MALKWETVSKAHYVVSRYLTRQDRHFLSAEYSLEEKVKPKVSQKYVGEAFCLLMDMEQKLQNGEQVSISDMCDACKYFVVSFRSFEKAMDLKRAYHDLEITKLLNKYSLRYRPWERKWN